MGKRCYYIDLHSNVVNEEHKNTAAHFFTKLAQPLSLEGEWQATLLSITYPNNYYNLKNDCKITFFDPDDYDLSTEGRKLASIDVKRGRYESVESLIDHIHDQLKPLKEYAIGRFRFVYDKNTKRVKTGVCMDPIEGDIPMNRDAIPYHPVIRSLLLDPLNITFSTIDLPMLLGFTLSEFEGSERNMINTPYEGSTVASLHHHYTGFELYTNIIKPHWVGDKFVKSLEFVPFISDKPIGYMLNLVPREMELESNYIDTIEILLCDLTGREIHFPAGGVQLHLKIQEC
jgi:hypothetical protein